MWYTWWSVRVNGKATGRLVNNAEKFLQNIRSCLCWQAWLSKIKRRKNSSRRYCAQCALVSGKVGLQETFCCIITEFARQNEGGENSQVRFFWPVVRWFCWTIYFVGSDELAAPPPSLCKNEDYSRDKIRATYLLSWRHSPLFDEPLVFTFPSSLKVLTEGDPLRQEIFRLQLVRAWRMRNRKEDAAVAEAISRVTKVWFLLVHLNFR